MIMKKKITNFFLLLTMIIVGSSSFVSCKDYESDEMGSLKQQLRELIITQATDVEGLSNDILKLQQQVGGWDEVTNGTIAEVLTQTKETANNAQQAANDANSRLNQLFGANNDLNSAVSQLTCIVDLINRVEALENMVNGDGNASSIQSQLNNLSNKLSTMTNGWTGNLVDLSNDATKALALAKEDSVRLDAIDALLAQNDLDIQDIRNQLTLLNGNYTDLSEAVQKVQADLDSIGGELDGVKGDVAQLKSDVAAAQTTADEAKADAAAAMAEATRLFEEAKGLIETAKQEAITAAQEAADAALGDAKDYTDGQINITKQELESAYKAADAVLDQKIDSVKAELLTLLNKLSDAAYKMVTGVIIQGTENAVTGNINTPFDISTNVLAAYYGYNKTGVNVVFPVGEGRGYSNFYVRPEEAKGFTPLIESQPVAEADGLLMFQNSEEYGGNAGKLYLTVNPSSANMSGMQFTLVDTRDDAAPGYDKLTLTKCNDYQMSFGWKRSAAENGFYVANANVKDPQAAKADINMNVLESVAKEALNRITRSGNNRLSIAEAVSMVYNEINNKFVAYGVKIPGKFIDAEGNEQTRNIYSEYKLAATAIKPLSYATLKDGINKQVPMLPTLESKGIYIDMSQFQWTPIEEMDSIEVEVEMDNYPDLNDITIDGIPAPEVTIETPNVTVKKIFRDNLTHEDTESEYDANGDPNILIDVLVTVDDVDVTVGDMDFSNANVTIGTTTETMTVKVPMDQFNEMIKGINDQVGGMLNNVTDLADKFNSYIPAVDKYINKINAYIQKFNNKLRNINSLLQITMMYETPNGGYAQLNAVNSKSAATQMKLGSQTEGGIMLLPTSYTAEMFAPALKKYVAVTAAPSEAAKAYANSATNMNQILDGRCRGVMFRANEKGLYEISYSAVDFHGFITTRKFYINVE